MIYGHDSISTYTRSNLLVWMALAFQAGVINIGGFMACHRFVSHVTGFATFFGVEVSKREFGSAIGMLIVPFLFLCGAMMSAQLVDIRLQLKKKPKYYIVLGLLFFLTLLVVVCGFNKVFGTFGAPLERPSSYALLALLCLICGLQNGMITTVSKSVVRTTHLTGMVTDLGIGLVRLLNTPTLGRRTALEILPNLMRIGIIFFFGLGSVTGAFLFSRAGYRGFLLPTIISGLLFGGSIYFQVLRPPPDRTPTSI